MTKATQIIWLVTGILEALIGIPVVLRILAASPEAGFAQFIYSITGVFLAPFSLLFKDPSAVGAALEVSSVVAMLICALAAWGLVRILWVT
ncbi:MAG: YggT family protein [Anaerolineae bacterium]